MDLAGLDFETAKNDQGRPLDGFSLKPFLKTPNLNEWEGPDGALSVVYSSYKMLIYHLIITIQLEQEIGDIYYIILVKKNYIITPTILKNGII